MKKINLLFIICAMSAFSFQNNTKDPLNTLSAKELKENWQLLFDGKTTNNWRGENSTTFPKKGWEIKEGCLVSGKGGNIVTIQEFGNFDFKWEWKMETKGGNSGVKYFVKEKNGTALGIEYQMLDDVNHEWMLSVQMKPNDYHTNGAVYELYPTSPDKKTKPFGEWNESRIISKGNHVEHWLNGSKVAEYERRSDDFKARVAQSKFKDVDQFGLHNEGMLMLTDHESVVYFRNLKIRKL